MLNKIDISKFDLVTLGKMSVGGGLGTLQFLSYLKMDTRTFNFRLNEPSRDIL